MIEARNAAWRLWILVKLNVAPGEIAGVLFAERLAIRSRDGVWRRVLSLGRMRNLRGHRHDQGSGQKHGKEQRGRDPAPADLLLSEVLHNSSQRAAIQCADGSRRSVAGGSCACGRRRRISLTSCGGLGADVGYRGS